MSVITRSLEISMSGKTDIENITMPVEQALGTTGLQSGIVTIFLKHTTASVLIIEDEPGIREDTQMLWDRLIPADPLLKHNTLNKGEDNAHSHLRGQMQGVFLTIPFSNSQLTLGTWQQIVIVDFDTRGRTRQVVLQFIGE